ncbi:hypothetical protein NL676_011046 [Syzygium grande]|nr:hypothetical protein NL676_011046 [Syzygium grande]
MPAFGASGSPAFGLSTPACDTSSTPVFGASRMPASGTSNTPSFSFSTPVFGAPCTPTCGASSKPTFGTFSSPSFTSSATDFGASSKPTFGASSSPSFGFGSSPAFGQSTSAFGGSPFRPASSPFRFEIGAQATTPTFGYSGFGQSPFGGQGGGSRVAPYTPTTEADSGRGTQQAGKLESLLAMPVYEDKSHDELRWEDYQSGDKGGPIPAGQSAGAVGFSAPPSAPSPAFGQSYPFASTITSNPFGASFTPAFGASAIPAFGASSIPSFSSSTPAFNASSTPAFGASSVPAFGASSCPSFSFGSSPVFGQSISTFGDSPFGPTSFPFENQIGVQATTPHWKIWSFHIICHARALATAPTSGSSGFGQSPFGGQRGGSRVVPYTPTTEADSGSGIEPANKLESLLAMPAYKDKSHEELRWEDYQLGDTSGPNRASQSAGAVGFSATASTPSPSFGQSYLLASTTTSDSFGASNTPALGASRAQAATPHWKIWSMHLICDAGAQATTPKFGSSGFGQSSFEGQRGGSRVAPYTPTTEEDSGNGTQPADKLESLLPMPVCKDKSHEELRWEDYQSGDKGGPNPAGQSAGAIGFGAPLSTPSPAFGQSSPFASTRASNPFASTPFGSAGFGSSPPPSISPFGSSTAPTTPHLFGSTQTLAFGANSSSCIFSTSGPSAFGSSLSNFSSPTMACTPFGSGLTSQSSPLFSSTTPSTGQSGSAFGQSTSTFGQTASLFGQNTSPFGQTTNHSLGQTNTSRTLSSGLGESEALLHCFLVQLQLDSVRLM